MLKGSGEISTGSMEIWHDHGPGTCRNRTSRAVLGKAAVSPSKIQSAKGLPSTFCPEIMAHERSEHVMSYQNMLFQNLSTRHNCRIGIGGLVYCLWKQFHFYSWERLSKHSYGMLLQEIHMRHLCKKLFVGPHCKTPFYGKVLYK